MQFSFGALNRKQMIGVLAPLGIIIALAIVLFTYEKIQQAKNARGYILELQNIDNLEEDKRAPYIENIFNQTNNSFYKVYFGTRLINEFYKKNPDKAIGIARQILSIRNLPDYISDAILTKLSYIYLDQLSYMKDKTEKSKEIESYLLSNKATDTAFYPLRRESYLEILLVNGDLQGYYNGVLELEKDKQKLPEPMIKRLDQMKHSLGYLIKSLDIQASK